VIGNPLLLGDEGGYNLTRSLRFRSSASAYLNRTFSTPTDNKKFTWSGWVKRGTLGAKWLFSATPDAFTTYVNFGFANGSGGSVDALTFDQYSGGYQVRATTNALYRDPAAWYHIVVVWDTANATSTERTQIWVNGVRTTVTYAFGPVSQNTASILNATSSVNYLGSLTSIYFDGYMAEVNFIDGQALAPTAFGSFSPYNQWLPKKYAGTYGTNGFYLPFTNNASTTTLGYDFSPQGNNWTTNNISVTAGSTYDSMTDVPTLTSATAANYCVGNPLASDGGPLSNGNLSWRVDNTRAIVGGMAFDVAGTSNFYMEATVTGIASTLEVGIVGANRNFNGNNIDPASYANGYGYISNGNKKNNNSATSYGATFTTGDVIGIYAGNGTLTFYKNNTSQGSAFTGLTGDMVVFAFGSLGGGNTSTTLNFGQQPFTYTPPSGYVALNTYNL